MARPEFVVHRLNADGLFKADEIARAFSDCLSRIEAALEIPQPGIVIGEQARCLAVVRTKLQEACFFAKRAIAVHEDNQEED